jgi:translation initiation factor IF-2
MEKDKKTSSSVRPPIVTILGHVDHGKTTLLDTIRKTRVALKEKGGITQKIGASEVKTKEGKMITFIDTPGHAAFSKMRSRGAKVADIAILVVAAGDGVMPQTKEALSFIREAEIPFIVALTKIDLPSTNIESVLGQLEKENVLFEGRGGDTPYLGVSAKTGKGIEELLELISLVADVNEIKANKEDALEALVIESVKDQRGISASVIVRNGSVKVGDSLFSDAGSFKVRGILTEKGGAKEILPGFAGQVLGFEILPEVGSRIASSETAFAKKEEKQNRIKVGKEEVGVVIKAENKGALEAVLNNLPAGAIVVEASVGDIYESDVLMAKSSGGLIFAFEAKASSGVSKLAEAEGVTIKSFDIIYELFEALEALVQKGKTVILGKAEIVAIFPFNNKKIAGCKILSGKISKNTKLLLMRDEKEIGKVRAISLKKQKQEVSEVSQGEEFGVLIEPQLDFAKGDMLVSVA